MFNHMVLLLNQPTDMLEEINLVKLLEEASKFQVKTHIQDVLDYKTELTQAQFQLQLMLLTGANMEVEFSVTALLQSTTLSY
jgi:hypothetical protein